MPAQTCPVYTHPDWFMQNLFCLPNKSALSVQHITLAIVLLRNSLFEFACFEKTFIHFLSIMAFITNVDELQALLDACSLTQELEVLIQSILIPDEWIPMVYARLSELTAQEIPVSILFHLSSSLIFFCCCFSFHVTEASVH